MNAEYRVYNLFGQLTTQATLLTTALRVAELGAYTFGMNYYIISTATLSVWSVNNKGHVTPIFLDGKPV